MFMYSAYFSMKMLVTKLAQMDNFRLAKSNAMWPMAQMITGRASLASSGFEGDLKKTASYFRRSWHQV